MQTEKRLQSFLVGSADLRQLPHDRPCPSCSWPHLLPLMLPCMLQSMFRFQFTDDALHALMLLVSLRTVGFRSRSRFVFSPVLDNEVRSNGKTIISGVGLRVMLFSNRLVMALACQFRIFLSRCLRCIAFWLGAPPHKGTLALRTSGPIRASR